MKYVQWVILFAAVFLLGWNVCLYYEYKQYKENAAALHDKNKEKSDQLDAMIAKTDRLLSDAIAKREASLEAIAYARKLSDEANRILEKSREALEILESQKKK